MDTPDSSGTFDWRAPALWVLAGVVLAWLGVDLRAFGLAREYLAYLAFVLTVVFGLGAGIVGVAGVSPQRAGHVLVRLAAGWVGVAVVSVAAVYVGAPDAAFAAVTVCGLAGFVWLGWRARADLSGALATTARSTSIAFEAVLAAVVLRVFAGGPGSEFWVSRGARIFVPQYFDLGYHLGFIKAGMYRGLPIDEFPLLAGFPRISYHPGFDTLGTTVIQGLRMSPDAAYYALVLPATYAAFVCAVYAAARAWGGHARAGVVALAMMFVSLIAALTPEAWWPSTGQAGLVLLRWWMFNPPGALGGAAALLIVVALAGRERLTARTIVVAAVLAGATMALKAQIALAVGPAFVMAIVWAAWRGRARWRDAFIGACAAALSAGLAYVTTTGEGDPPGVVLGAMARYLPTSRALKFSGLLVREFAGFAHEHPWASVPFLVFYILVAMTGWRLLVGGVALWIARRRGERPFAASPVGVAYGIGIVAWTVVVALTVVQRGGGEINAWNVSWHTLQLMYPLGVVAAAVAVDVALGDGPVSRLSHPVQALIVGALVVAMAWVGVQAMGPTRLVSKHFAPRGFARVAAALPQYTPPDAVVAQIESTGYEGWVAEVGGRRAYAERTESGGTTGPEAQRRVTLLKRLYSETDPSWTRDVLLGEGIDYVIVRSRGVPAGLKGATVRVMSAEGFELRQTLVR